MKIKPTHKTSPWEPEHWNWCIKAGWGNFESGRDVGGDIDATNQWHSKTAASHNSLPAISIPPAPPYPNISKWEEISTGIAGRLLQALWAIHYDLFDKDSYKARKEMDKAYEWTKSEAIPVLSKLMIFLEPFLRECHDLGRVPVFLGRDCYYFGYVWKMLRKDFYYIEGVSRHLVSHCSDEYIKSCADWCSHRQLVFVDTGFAGSIPKTIVRRYFDDGSLTDCERSRCMYLISSEVDVHMPCFANCLGRYDKKRAQHDYTFNAGHAGIESEYRDKAVIKFEYFPKLYLRPNTLQDGIPILEPSGDANLAGFVATAMVGLIENRFTHLIPKKKTNIKPLAKTIVEVPATYSSTPAAFPMTEVYSALEKLVKVSNLGSNKGASG